MAISLTHTTVATGTDAGNGEIRKAQWNEAHTLTMATDRILGRTTAAAGAVEELSVGTGLALSAGSLTLDADLQTWAGITPASGIGTWLATPSSANLAAAVTDETGSGALVFATSPTLVTPTLGVATATSINKVALTAPATSATLTIADGKTLTASNTLTFTGTDTSSVAFGAGGTVAYTANKLSAFAATTSAELAGVISDETGSGALVFGTSPTIASPTISGTVAGSFTASGAVTFSEGSTPIVVSANTVSLMRHSGASGAYFDVNIGGTASWFKLRNGSGFREDISIATDGTTTFVGDVVLPSIGPSSTLSVGYRGLPQNTQNANYTGVLADAGKHFYHDNASTYTWTIPANASVAYPIGTVLTFINNGSGNITIAITTDTLAWNSSTGSRTLAQYGVATATKVTSTRWMLTGNGIT